MPSCFSLLQEAFSPVELAMVAAAAPATVQAAATVEPSPSPQSQASAQAEGSIKKESHLFFPLETLKFDLNLYPFTVLWETIT